VPSEKRSSSVISGGDVVYSCACAPSGNNKRPARRKSLEVVMRMEDEREFRGEKDTLL
jgi:hypothetical protein